MDSTLDCMGCIRTLSSIEKGRVSNIFTHPCSPSYPLIDYQGTYHVRLKMVSEGELCIETLTQQSEPALLLRIHETVLEQWSF